MQIDPSKRLNITELPGGLKRLRTHPKVYPYTDRGKYDIILTGYIWGFYYYEMYVTIFYTCRGTIYLTEFKEIFM